MNRDVVRFMPVAGLFIGLLVAFAFDPMAMFLSWSTLWLPFAGLAAGFALRFGLQRYDDAR